VQTSLCFGAYKSPLFEPKEPLQGAHGRQSLARTPLDGATYHVYHCAKRLITSQRSTTTIILSDTCKQDGVEKMEMTIGRRPDVIKEELYARPRRRRCFPNGKQYQCDKTTLKRPAYIIYGIHTRATAYIASDKVSQ
jgi:hypothetical protein